jgi:hypothetical protein
MADEVLVFGEVDDHVYLAGLVEAGALPGTVIPGGPFTDEAKEKAAKEAKAAEEASIAAAAAQMGEAPASESKYDGYTVEELRDELRDRALAVSGTKDELVARLEEDDG